MGEIDTQGATEVIAAGDWHGNVWWATSQVAIMAGQLEGQPSKLIFHAGDFGIWPGGRMYLNVLDEALEKHDMKLYFTPGNHEDYQALDATERSASFVDVGPPYMIRSRIFYLPRGFRWTMQGKEWLAVGGAASVDAAWQKQRGTWWERETVTREEADTIKAAGPADVLLTHDVGSSVPDRYLSLLQVIPSFWDNRDLARAQAHRELMQEIANAVRPGHWIHGHYHSLYETTVTMNHGDVHVTGLDMDGKQGNWFRLDLRTMEWKA